MRFHILLIEDDRELHDAIVRFLERRGHRVTACRSEAEAARALARGPDRTQAPEVFIARADCMGLYLKVRARFPGIRWVVIANGPSARDVDGALPAGDESPYDASVDQPDVTFPRDGLD